jgi:mediator of RNA polymerase II transcription subunit 5
MALLHDKRMQNATSLANFDTVTMHRVVVLALGIPNGGNSSAIRCKRQLTHRCAAQSQPASIGSQILGQSQPRQAIRDAIAKARGSKAPVLDVERCIKTCGCEKFLRTLWSELLTPANLGETDVCTRIATFALTIPRPLSSPPLLAMFLNILLPGLLSTIDNRQVGDQTVAIELLGSIVSSILTASLHLDLAFSEVSRPVLGQPSIVIARRVAVDLRFRAKRHSHASKMILQRLGSSQSFVANFPVFKLDS